MRLYLGCPVIVVLGVACGSKPSVTPDAAIGGPRDAPEIDATPPSPSLAIFPTEVTVVAGATRVFRADAVSIPSLTWTLVEGASGGTLVDGAYVAPATAGTYHVEVAATSAGLMASATVHVVAAPTHATFSAPEVTTIVGFSGHEMRLVDVDNDGDLDIINAYRGMSATDYGRVQLLENDGTGTFMNVTATDLGTVQAMHARDWAIADFNGDGRLDVAMADHGWDQPPFPGDQSRLLQQTSDGKLADVTATALPAMSSFTHNICAGDLDKDGDADLVVTNLGPASNFGAHVYQNNGSGQFTNQSLPLTSGTFTSCAIFDLDNDGSNDVFLGNTQGETVARDVILRNANGALTPIAGALPPRYKDASWATVDANSVDVDRDGWLDLVLTVYDSSFSQLGLQVLINQGNRTFADGKAMLPAYPNVSGVWIWATPADLDGTGWPALVIAGDGNAPRVYVHDGTKLVESGMDFSGLGRLWPGDLDGDGDVDLVGHGFGSTLTVYRNQRLP